MKKNFSHIAKHSFIYSLGTAAPKFGGIILVPLYTGYYSLNDFGLLALFIAIINFGSQILMLGQGESLIRLNNDEQYKDDKKPLFFTITALMFFIMLAVSLFSIFVLYSLDGYIDFFRKYSEYLLICIATIFATVMNKLFLNKLRADERSVLYTGVNILKLFVIIIFSFYFLLHLKMGIEGVLYATLISEVLALVVVLFPMLKDMQFNFMKKIVVFTLAFGFPLAFATITNTILTTSDRFIIKWLSGDAELGLYDLAYRVATLLNMVVIMPLTLTLYPIIFKMYGKSGDKEYYIKVHKFSAIILFWAGAGISLIGNETIRILAKAPEYYSASPIVPLLTMSLVFSGLAWLASIGLNLSGNTKYIALSGLIAAGLNIVLNIFTVPFWGNYAAAANTILSMIILYILYIVQSKKHFEIKYEHSVILKAFLLFTLYYFAGFFLEVDNLFLSVLYKFLFFLTFPLWFLFINVFNKDEKMFFNAALKKLKNPAELIIYIKNNFTKIS